MSDLNLVQFNEFKEALASLKFPKVRQQTFLEIIDLHRIEAVSSKLLAFVFDSDADHGLGNLAILALINAANKKIRAPKSIEVITELTCKGRKGRIDIVIELQEHLIVIENKIAHSLDNPFDLYIKHCAKTYKHIPSNQRFFFIMGNTKPSFLPIGFEFISHSNFGKSLNSLLESSGNEELKKNYYFHFIQDYIQAMESMNPKLMHDTHHDVLEFCQDNYEMLQTLDEQRSNICLYAHEKLINTLEHLDENLFSSNDIILHKKAEWGLLGAYVESNPIKISGRRLNLYITAEWYLQKAYITFAIYKSVSEVQLSEAETLEILKTKGIKTVKNGDLIGTILYQQPSKNLDVRKFAREINKIYQLLIAADD